MSRSALEKLGYKAGMTGWTVACPDDLRAVIDLPEQTDADADLIIAFAASIADVERQARMVVPHYRPGRALWFAYPKKSGAIRSDISRDEGWQVLSALDLLPVSQIAIDENWSALRFRYRSEIGKLTRKADFPGQAGR